MENTPDPKSKIIVQLVQVICVMSLIILVMAGFLFMNIPPEKTTVVPNNPAWNDYHPNGKKKNPEDKKKDLWLAPDSNSIASEKNADLVVYGKELIRNTSKYIGPKGSVAQSTNGMNCQNCHLDAGTKSFGNNYSAVYSTYPKFRERSGSVENIYKRVNDCFERSLNGRALDTNSKEMQAIYAYIKWLGKNVKKKEKPNGAGIPELDFMNRAADPSKGKIVYTERCQSCHGKNGEGKLSANETAYIYPPLWGEHSYNNGAGLLRLTRFAGFVKANMPWGATYDNPQLTDEQAWDVAAFVNSQPRPKKDISKDWPKLSGKPFDNPYGPYADKFSEQQHRYGPFTEMKRK